MTNNFNLGHVSVLLDSVRDLLSEINFNEFDAEHRVRWELNRLLGDFLRALRPVLEVLPTEHFKAVDGWNLVTYPGLRLSVQKYKNRFRAEPASEIILLVDGRMAYPDDIYKPSDPYAFLEALEDGLPAKVEFTASLLDSLSKKLLGSSDKFSKLKELERLQEWINQGFAILGKAPD